MFTLCTDRAGMPEVLSKSLFADRGSQFVGRFGWDLTVTPEGMEIDTYDDRHSAYVMVTNGADHLGSCRVRPFESGTMLMDHFRGVFPGLEVFMSMQSGRFWELTRFCRDPEMSVTESREMLRYLAVALDRFRDAQEITGFMGVVFAPVARFLQRIGVRFVRLGVARIDGRAAHLICLTHAIEPGRLADLYDGLEATVGLDAAPIGLAAA